MPVGNGDPAANLWTDQNGFVLLVSKADAWTELNKPVKLARICLRLAPNPFAGAAEARLAREDTEQELFPQSGDSGPVAWILDEA